MLVKRNNPHKKQPEYKSWVFNREQIPAAWPELEPFVLKALPHGNGELTEKDIYYALCHDEMCAFAVARNDVIELIWVVELICYPQYRTVNIVLLSGNNLAEAAATFYTTFEEWAAHVGAVAVEARCHEAQARLFRRLGFRTAYRAIRKEITKRSWQ